MRFSTDDPLGQPAPFDTHFAAFVLLGVLNRMPAERLPTKFCLRLLTVFRMPPAALTHHQDGEMTDDCEGYP